MMFWIIFLLMLVAAIMCILGPLAYARESDDQDARSLDVYRKQLEELPNLEDVSPQNAEAIALQKNEISRRVLKENRRLTKQASVGRSRSGRVIAITAALLGIPIISIAFYWTIGSPSTPDVPLAAVRSNDLESKSVQEMVQIAERHLAKNPDDLKGWNVLANVYGRINRPDDRVRALEQVLRISGPSPRLLADLGEALTIAVGNIVPKRARKMFEAAWNEDKTVLKASVFLALAYEQEGKPDKALEHWTNLSAKRQDDANWQTMVAERIAKLKGQNPGKKLVGPDRTDIENASQLNADDRTNMIVSMVDRLSQKLKDNPDNFEGWMRLIRSYVVLKRKEDAAAALANAKAQFATQPARIVELDKLAKQTGLDLTVDSGANN